MIKVLHVNNRYQLNRKFQWSMVNHVVLIATKTSMLNVVVVVKRRL